MVSYLPGLLIQPLAEDVTVALRDDDADDDEGAGLTEKEAEGAGDENMDVEEETRKKPRDVQPTGRVVGIIKRNWRA